jgi:SH3-like domain-containing protein
MAASNRLLIFLLVFFTAALPVLAADGISSAVKRTGLPVPRWAALRSDEVNMRVGPGARYPISWNYTRKGLPVEIIAEFDTWRKIRDPSGEIGWMHQATLSGKRGFLVAGRELAPLFRKADPASTMRAQLQPGAQGRLIKCAERWCKVEADGITGYMDKTSLYGVYKNEKFD